MEQAYNVTDDISVLPSYFTVPGLGMIPVNAFVLRAKTPVLIDAGLVMESDAFMETLRSVIDPQDLRWIWLTHTDQDHIGSLYRLLQEVRHLRVITSFLGMGKMGLFSPLPPDRVFLLNPGQSIDLGDRTLTAVKPPIYDAPETTGCYDNKNGVFFSSDCFGAVLASPAENAADIGAEELAERQALWATIDSPWLHYVDVASLSRNMNAVRDMSPEAILSNHLPPAIGMTDQLLGALDNARGAEPFVGPDQTAFEAMLAQMTGSQP
jgi:flavorubredoxin